ncbi:hypothetical protein OIA45_48555 (plasmid) [Streptomyces chartreusis]|uniref:hypothetical protein n=1 Tax=Streptomyces chartreusis TaxID=1969 RepID=UPI0037DDB974|nr:hypothetical protein OIA45_48555 [Streptomyces chartreusis]
MASDTVPAAVPDPVGQPATSIPSGPDTGPLAGLLTPIEPARPNSAAFNLNPDATTDTAADQAYAGTTSAIYTSADEEKNTKKGGQDTRVMRAFALAAIERWKKGADARNKRLDIQKAIAQAHQVKESRTVNRSEKILGGSSNSGTGSGKSMDSKARNGGGGGGGGSKNGPSKNSPSKNGPSNGGGSKGGGSHTGGKGHGSTGGSGVGGHHSAGGRGHGGGSGAHGSGGRGTPGGHSDTKHRPDTKKRPGNGGQGPGGHSGTSGAGGSKNSPAGKAGPKGDAGTAGKDGKQGTGTASTGSTGTGGGGSAGGGRTKLSDALKNDTHNAADRRLTQRRSQDHSKPVLWKDSKQDSKDTTAKDPKNTDRPRQDTPKPANGKPVDVTGAAKTPKRADDTPGNKHEDAKDTAGARGGKTQPTTRTRKRLNTLPSRETGYRDGARTATAIGHVKAYRDGFKDGHRDTSQLAERQKKTLDRAHARRKAARDKDQPVNASSTDHAPRGPRPVDVKEVTDSHITLDGGQTYSRGEVRNLKQYERRMGEKATTMGKAAEGTKQLEAHAAQQAEHALKLLEMSKNVEGGDKLVGSLNRLHESATVQGRKAQELHRRVARAAENTRVVLANVETRYGSIYKAVCDSDLTKPAELAWYRK